MKIAFMAYDRPNYFGGPITNARRLLPELVKRGHEIHALIFYHEGDAPSARYLRSQGVNCHVVPWESYPYTETKIKWILNTIKMIQPDVFVPNISVAGYFASKWIRKAGIPTIAAHRSDDAFHWSMVDEFVIGDPQWAVSGLVCVSDYLRKRVESLKPKYTELLTIPSGVPIPEKSSNQTGSLKIAYVGRLVQQQKRIRDVFEALVKVTQKLSDVTVTFFGEGNEKSYLEAKVKQDNLSSRINFKGAIPSEKLHDYLVNYHILVLLSDYEGTPGAVMDGMACGLVPICLDIPGGVQELVIHNQTGLLVSDRGEVFFKAVERLYHNSELRIKLGNNAREHIINEYSLSVATNRWDFFCRKLITEAKPSTQINIPLWYKLPPVRQGIDREDHRELSLIQKIKEQILLRYYKTRMFLGKIKQKILNYE